MIKQPKVSVVVPIYGVEKYLHQCVDSILAQTLEDIEIILVDDGSKDKCPEIVDEYAKKDPRIVAVHQPNGGYGRAVNHGIELAKGEYIGIVESDDWIEPDMYEKLYNNAKENNTDVTKGEFYIYNSFLPEAEQNNVWKNRYQDLDEAPDNVFSIDEYPLLLAFHASIWSSIYKAEFIKQQQVIESRSASYQDFPFMVEAFCRAKRITIVKEPLVHYRMEEGMGSSTLRRDARLMIMADQCQKCKEHLIKYKKHETLKEEFYFHAFLANDAFYNNILFKHKYEYFLKIKNLFHNLKNDNNFTFKYFTSEQKKSMNYYIHGNFYRELCKYILKQLRKFIIRIIIKPQKKQFVLQFLGLRISKNKHLNTPCILDIKL